MEKKDRSELTLKQQRFTTEYGVDLNATAAYARAGYSARGNSAEACASRLLRNAKVLHAIVKRENQVTKRCEITTEDVLQEVRAIASSDVRKMFNADGSMKSIHEFDDATAASIRSFETCDMYSVGEVVGKVYKVKLWDKNNAHERLLKYRHLFEKNNSDSQHPHKINVSFVSGDGQKMSFSDFQKRGEK